MSRRNILVGVGLLCLIILLVRPEILGALFAFIFLGLIPGTQLSLPFWAMLIIYALGAILVIRWLISQPLYVGNLAKQEQTARAIARKKVTAKKKSTTTRKRQSRKAARA